MKIIFLFTLYFLVMGVSYAVQPESPVACNEGVEPLQLNYGDHTTGCAFEAVTDLDQFSFIGSAGDVVRINVSSRIDNSDPFVEVRDPDGTVIFDQFCDGGCSIVIDLSLTISGTYTVTIQETRLDETGVYQLQLEKIPPVAEPRSFPYDLALDDELNPVTDLDFFSFEGIANTDVRINVSSRIDNSDPFVEVRDPDGTVIFDQFCDGSCSIVIDLSLTISGTYTVTVQETRLDETGEYQLNFQCLFGPCPPNFASALIIVTPTLGLSTNENGGTDTFSIVLNGEPSASVTIGLSSDDISEGAVSPASLTFTPENWDIPQEVTITGQDDPNSDGSQQYKIITALAVSEDTVFNDNNPDDISVVNLDNDSTGGSINIDIDGNGVDDALTDGLLILRYLFGSRGAALIDGAVDSSGCTRCTAVEIEAYFDSITSI
ncbi:MAG: hypothetical protein V3U88_05280 [Methylococcales bacterium]